MTTASAKEVQKQPETLPQPSMEKPAPNLQAPSTNSTLQSSLGNAALSGAAADGSAPGDSNSLGLQSTYGNAAVAQSVVSPEGGRTSATTPAATVSALIVEDDVETVGAGQMKKSEFLTALRTEVCKVTKEALTGTQWSEAGCTDIDPWFGYYAGQRASHVDQAARRYVGQAGAVTNARDYIPLIGERVRQAVGHWAKTGRITGVPAGVPMLPGMGGQPSLAGIQTALSTATATGAVLPKANSGGLRQDADPQMLRAELGDGRPLSGEVQSRMGSAFGQDFSNVRLHTDTKAERISADLNARAFTVGDHIAFGSGEYQPGTLVGDAIIAHELAHVVQQGVGSAGVMQKGEGSYGALEEDADKTAVGIVSDLYPEIRKGLGGVTHNTVPRLRSGLQLQRCCGFMVPKYPAIVYEEAVDLGGDPFWIEASLDPETVEVGPAKIPHRKFVVWIKYTGKDDAMREEIDFPPHFIPDTPINPKISSEKKEIKKDADTYTVDEITMDVFGNGTHVFTLAHQLFLRKILTPPIREHEFCLRSSGGGQRKLSHCYDLAVKSWLAEKTKPSTPPEAGGEAQPTPGLEKKKLAELPTSTLMEIALQRMAEIKPHTQGITTLEQRIQKDLSSPAGKDEATLRSKVEQLSDALVTVQPVFPALTSLAKKENYLSGIAEQITGRANEIKNFYVIALEAIYVGDKNREEKLATAEQAMLAFPELIVKLYLSSAGIESTVNESQKLREDLLRLRAMTKRALITRPADRMVRFGESKSLEVELIKALGEAREKRFLKEPDVATSIQNLSYNAQTLVAVTTALALHEQFIYWEQELDDSIVDWLLDPKLKLTRQYRLELDTILKTFEKFGSGKTVEGNQAFIKQGIDQVTKLTSSAEFKGAVEAIQERLKTIATVNVIGKVVLITAAAALTAGAAGAAVGGALEAAGVTGLGLKAGVLAAEALAFTVTSQVGQTVAFGKPSEGFLTELGWNALMLGVVKAATAGYARVFKLMADPKLQKVAFTLGKLSTATISLQAFAEAQHAIKTGKAMTGEERYRSILQNVILTVALEAGRFITKPIETRIEAAIGAKLKGIFSEKFAELQTDRAAMLERIQKLERGQSTNEEVGKLLEDIQQLWMKELKLISDGVQRKAITEAEAAKASESYKAQIALLELRLSQIGFEAPLGAGAPSFRPVRPGVVAYTPDAKPVLEAFHKARGGTLRESSALPDMLEGRLPSGEVTFYVPEGTTSKQIPAAEQIVSARDLARQEATADPLAAEGFKRLESKDGINLGPRKADEVLANANPENLSGFLRALRDPAFTQQLSANFYTGLAAHPEAALFARTYGGDVLGRLYRNYGKQWSSEFLDALAGATQRLEAAATPAARQELLNNLRTITDRTKIETLLGKPPPPKPSQPQTVTKKNMGIDRSSSLWKTLRQETEQFAKDHGENLTTDQLDLRADLDQVVDNAKNGRFDKLGQSSKIDILDRYDELAAKSGMLRVWINAKRGNLSEALFLPKRGVKKFTFKGGVEVPWGTQDATVPDYAMPQQGLTEWVNQKSDIIDSGRKSLNVYRVGLTAARRYRTIAVKEAKNLPPGDKYSLDFIRDPGPDTRTAMLNVLFAPGSPVHRVKFGETWYER